jgi:lipopolysaccharide/colanic/teichoic acid biosynthesis glycosyltransferase
VYAVTKRSLDVAGALALLLVTAPILAAAAFLVRVTMGRPVLYRQRRAGKDGRIFVLRKLRTMRDVAPNESGMGNTPAPATTRGPGDGARLTVLGRRLRALSIDELPQLWHVLRGEMSLVGPRPLLPEYLPRYSPIQARRHEVRPGLTGLAQVSGRNALSWSEKLALDVAYVERRGLALDLWILWRTLRIALRRDGIAAPGSATMPEFLGDDAKGGACATS